MTAALESLTGRTYGPFSFELSAAKVAEYVAATGDQPDRWVDHAPPSYAGAVLFKAAPAFLFDPDVGPHAKLLIHGEQSFAWPAPWRVGSRLTATGVVDRVRERSGVAFATFLMDVDDDEGRRVLEARSLFLMSADTPPGGGEGERSEPSAEARGPNEVPSGVERLPEAGSLADLRKSASRADLVRYAAASEDFNPMHWDHARAHEAGVGGVICHGLLMAAWATQPAVAASTRPDPLGSARFRFRAPLAPAEAAVVKTTVNERNDDLASLKATVASAAGDHVVADLELRAG